MSVKTSNAALSRPDFGETIDVNSDANLQAIDALLPGLEVDSADGAIALLNGVVMITKSSAAALTLAAPTSGTDDRKTLQIIAKTAFAHTVTTPSNKVNGSKHVVTFANAGDSVELVAYQGVWYSAGTPTAVLS